ncbi:DUF1336 domain-containing protein [Citrus sinensis]|uniref:DUF1336 domain-containing protein n=1 Tax=Citrus sinensis TaxID=2711 RepID=A0ACB8LJH5_CITSI|nr:DUF1336 domain-containing protein [Citrus sinensis]
MKENVVDERRVDFFNNLYIIFICGMIKEWGQIFSRWKLVRSVDDSWFDSVAIFESDGEDDDDFVSVQDGKQPVFLDEISSSVDEGSGKDEGLLDNCGIIPSNCLPCLASTVPSVEKRRSGSSSPPRPFKKTASKLSFKWKEGHANATLVSSKMLLSRPISGAQVPFCPIEKKMLDSWSQIEPNTFKVRGVNYLRDKKKEFAHNCAAYYPFGVDVFLSQRKIDHIARFVELPAISSHAKLPPMLVVNVQIPLYPTAIFQSEIDGEGISIVLYFKLNESYAKELPLHFQESIRVSWNLSSCTFLSHCFILLLSANVIFCNAAAGY